MFFMVVKKKEEKKIKEKTTEKVEKEKIENKKVKEEKVEEKVGGKEGDKVEEETEEVKMKISDLPGIGPAAVEKLEAGGIFDLMGVAVLGPKELSDISGLGESAARKAIQAARSMLDLGFQDGIEYEKKIRDIYHITTGSKNME